MKRRTKLAEKDTRIPDPRVSRWEEIIPEYLTRVESLPGEAARSLRFAMLLQELFGLQPDFIEDYVAGMEKFVKVRQKDRLLRGRADELFGNVVIEFEADISKKRPEAEEQLCKYMAILWSQEAPDARRPYLSIATDGVRFLTYSPTLADPAPVEVRPEDVHLQVMEEADWTKLKPCEVFYWLDRHLLRQEILSPTSERIVGDFGLRSHAFQTTTRRLFTLWQGIKAQSAFATIYDEWEKYLSIVYGSEMAGDELFIRHTYLATLAKLMSWVRITESKSLPEEGEIVRILEGRWFKEHGIENFIEEDFFSWLARSDAVGVGVSAARWLFSLLANYNLRGLSEDVLKSLYQELVDPETRHDLGEFYTPDWLAHRMVQRLLDENSEGALLDPACGSGTFLYLAIREKRQRMSDSPKTLGHILDSVWGADIHPLAAIIAKTNYILALGDLLKARRGPVTIPIYLANTIRLPERWAKTEAADYQVTINGWSLNLPGRLLEDPSLYDQAIELVKEFARQSRGEFIELEPFRNFLGAQGFPASDDDALVGALFAIAQALKRFIEADRDTIWAFVLKNIYKPLFFKKRFDFIVGNPPWLAFQFAEPDYQRFLRRQITEEYKLLRGRAENVPNLELATLFLLRAADLYLKEGGTIAFVLPRSLFSADQHDGLRSRSFKFSENSMETLFFREVWDCEGVAPLFNVPACVLLAEKREIDGMEYPIQGQILSGELKRKNASLAEAEKALTLQKVQFWLHRRGKRSFWGPGEAAIITTASYYKSEFQRGADIHPRSLWFVEVRPSPLGFDPARPPLETAERAKEQAKAAYEGLVMRGTVESRFLYATLLSTDLLPFGHLDYRLVVLPIETAGDHYRLIEAGEARRRGFLNLAGWLEKAQEEWTIRRGAKAEMMTALEWLNYRRKLVVQNPQTDYWVLYNVSGTYLTAAVIEKEPIAFEINGQEVRAGGFLADYVTYYLPTSNRDEAWYLSAVLNAPYIDVAIKPMQARGLWGARHICKKVLDLPIPRFEAGNEAHRRLAELGRECEAKVAAWLHHTYPTPKPPSPLAGRGERRGKPQARRGGKQAGREAEGRGRPRSIGRLRGMVREMLKEELAEIDTLVKGLGI